MKIDLLIDAPIIQKKINDFKKSVKNKFDEYASMREVLKEYSLYADEIADKQPSSDRKPCDLQPVLDKLYDKRAFIDYHLIWPDTEFDFDDDFGIGNALAIDENTQIFSSIKTAIEKKGSLISSNHELNDAINALGDMSDIIILTTESAAIYFRDANFHLTEFSAAAQRESEGQIKSYAGFYQYHHDKNIPIFRVRVNSQDTPALLLLNTKKLGKLIQYPPPDHDENAVLDDVFSFNIQPVTKDQEPQEPTRSLLDENIQPAWLKSKGNRDQQLRYLQQSVSIRIYRKSEFELDKYFDGYLWLIER